MLGKSPNQSQKNLFSPALKEIINPQEPLIQLADRITWQDLENDLSKFYSHTGTSFHAYSPEGRIAYP
ncbi:MAG TPA: hypothetical protein PK692_04525 [Bacteroidales bacterium]|nr:hypothetical protein [Bacteroidales bacterium]HQO07316.1 hypothetical protein [Bacteroidales bacterium]HQP52748.1 hypothetical protein [Bacteroidales bacterium]